MIYFIADEHYSHHRILEYQPNRVFNSVLEMNRELINLHNNIVNCNDTIYHLGDFSFCNPDEILKELKGNHILITGSHDHKKGTLWKEVYKYAHEIVVDKQIIFLSHYAHRRWPKSHYGSWHLFGHSHGNLATYGYSFDVGVDVIYSKFTPWSFDEIKERMSNIKVTEYKIFDKGYNVKS